MAGYLEVWRPDGPELVALGDERITIGRGGSNDVTLPGDAAVSRMHAVLESFRAGWCVRDLSSKNGTFVNGERIAGERPLRSGDEIRVGGARLVYRVDESPEQAAPTEGFMRAPELTRRERDVLVELCRPVLSGDVFTEPAPIRRIAEALVVTDAAVKQHLLRLYDKFGIHEPGERRRVRLANEAIRRSAVSIADLRDRSRE